MSAALCLNEDATSFLRHDDSIDELLVYSRQCRRVLAPMFIRLVSFTITARLSWDFNSSRATGHFHDAMVGVLSRAPLRSLDIAALRWPRPSLKLLAALEHLEQLNLHRPLARLLLPFCVDNRTDGWDDHAFLREPVELQQWHEDVTFADGGWAAPNAAVDQLPYAFVPERVFNGRTQNGREAFFASLAARS